MELKLYNGNPGAEGVECKNTIKLLDVVQVDFSPKTAPPSQTQLTNVVGWAALRAVVPVPR